MSVLPQRLTLATMGRSALCLFPLRSVARDQLDDDTWLMHELGFGEYVERRVEPTMQLRFPSGGRITYLHGDRRFLEERMRGMSVALVEGADLVDEHLVHIITRERA